MRRIRYQVACSLDGYIADANDETGWIVNEPGIDFAALFAQFDTLLMGRRTYEAVQKMGMGFDGQRVIVFSRTLKPGEHPGVEIVPEATRGYIDQLRAKPGKDIWLFGGGELFRSLLEIDRVDTVEPAIIPVLVGCGRPFLATPAMQKQLTLKGRREYPSGIVWLEYSVNRR